MFKHKSNETSINVEAEIANVKETKKFLDEFLESHGAYFETVQIPIKKPMKELAIAMSNIDKILTPNSPNDKSKNKEKDKLIKANQVPLIENVTLSRSRIIKIFDKLLAVDFNKEVIQEPSTELEKIFFNSNNNLNITFDTKSITAIGIFTKKREEKIAALKVTIEKNKTKIFDLMEPILSKYPPTSLNDETAEDKVINHLSTEKTQDHEFQIIYWQNYKKTRLEIDAQNKIKQQKLAELQSNVIANQTLTAENIPSNEFQLKQWQIYKKGQIEIETQEYQLLQQLLDLQQSIIDNNSNEISTKINEQKKIQSHDASSEASSSDSTNSNEVTSKKSSHEQLEPIGIQNIQEFRVKNYASIWQRLMDNNEEDALEILNYFTTIIWQPVHVGSINLSKLIVNNIADLAAFLAKLSNVSKRQTEKIISMLIKSLENKIYDLIAAHFQQESSSTAGRENTLVDKLIIHLVATNTAFADLVKQNIQPIIDIIDNKSVIIIDEKFNGYKHYLMCQRGEPKSQEKPLEHGYYLYRELQYEKIFVKVVHQTNVYEILDLTNIVVNKEKTVLLEKINWPEKFDSQAPFDAELLTLITENCHVGSANYTGDISLLKQAFSNAIKQLLSIKNYPIELQRIIYDFGKKNPDKLLAYILIRFINPIIEQLRMKAETETLKFWLQKIVFVCLQALNRNNKKQSDIEMLHPDLVNLVFDENFREDLSVLYDSATIDANQLTFQNMNPYSESFVAPKETTDKVYYLYYQTEFLTLEFDKKLLELAKDTNLREKIRNKSPFEKLEHSIILFEQQMTELKILLDLPKKMQENKGLVSEEINAAKNELVNLCRELSMDNTELTSISITSKNEFKGYIEEALAKVKAKELTNDNSHSNKIDVLMKMPIYAGWNKKDILIRNIEKICENLNGLFEDTQKVKINEDIKESHLECWEKLHEEFQKFKKDYEIFSSSVEITSIISSTPSPKQEPSLTLENNIIPLPRSPEKSAAQTIGQIGIMPSPKSSPQLTPLRPRSTAGASQQTRSNSLGTINTTTTSSTTNNNLTNPKPF